MTSEKDVQGGMEAEARNEAHRMQVVLATDIFQFFQFQDQTE